MLKFIVEEAVKVGADGERERPPSIPPADDLNPGISLKPVLKALEEIQYPGLVQIHVWRFQMREEVDSSAACLVRYLQLFAKYFCVIISLPVCMYHDAVSVASLVYCRGSYCTILL